MNITSGYFFLSAAISAIGLITPVEVSLWMTVRASNWPVASFLSTASARMGEPHGTCSASASLPHRLDTSNHLSENAPHMQLSTFLATRLRMAPSITPQAEEVLNIDQLLGVKQLLELGLDFRVEVFEPLAAMTDHRRAKRPEGLFADLDRSGNV